MSRSNSRFLSPKAFEDLLTVRSLSAHFNETSEHNMNKTQSMKELVDVSEHTEGLYEILTGRALGYIRKAAKLAHSNMLDQAYPFLSDERLVATVEEACEEFALDIVHAYTMSAVEVCFEIEEWLTDLYNHHNKGELN